MKTIFELENRVDVESFTYDGEKLWPVMRLFGVLARPKTNEGVKISLFRRFAFLWLGAKEFLQWKIRKRPKAKNLFLTSAHYKVEDGGQLSDRILDPFQQWLTDHGEEFSVIEYTHGLKYNPRISYYPRIRKVQAEIYFRAFFWKLAYKFFGDKTKAQGDFEQLNRELKNLGMHFRADANFFWRIYLLKRHARFFASYLKAVETKSLGIVCFYDFKSLALTWAANSLGIDTIDFQHGVQGPQHTAYGGWPKKAVQGSVFLPRYFWVWDKFSFDNIKQWKEKGVILGCNKWMLDRAKSNKAEILLFTCQPLENPLPMSFIEMIQAHPEKKWYVRLHPHQLSEMHKFETLLTKHGISEAVNIDEATVSPLTDLLAKTQIHLTKNSSVAIEASYYEVPTIFLEEKGRSYFAEQLPEHLQFYGFDKKGLETCMREILAQPEKFSFKSKQAELDRFENISYFYTLTEKK